MQNRKICSISIQRYVIAYQAKRTKQTKKKLKKTFFKNSNFLINPTQNATDST